MDAWICGNITRCDPIKPPLETGSGIPLAIYCTLHAIELGFFTRCRYILWELVAWFLMRKVIMLGSGNDNRYQVRREGGRGGSEAGGDKVERAGALAVPSSPHGHLKISPLNNPLN